MGKKNTIAEALNIFNKNFNHQIILYGPPGTSKTYSSTIIAASFLKGEKVETYDEAKKELNKNEHYQIVQFHPSYNYDDFVRGIKMSIKDGNPRYDVVNKLFGEFAEKAEKDWMHQLALKLEEVQSKISELEKISNEEKQKKIEELTDVLGQYKDIVSKISELEKISDEEKQKKIKELTDVLGQYIDIVPKISELEKISDEEKQKKIKELTDVLGQYKDIVSKISELEKILNDEEKQKKLSDLKQVLNDSIIQLLNQKSRYVLVIDEINRAPLASVLGEMIYGLEYRNQPISTSYKLENGTEKIVIPDNLYIIGTMNTADRSIGTIDYAVRRRFAFIPVLPNWDVVKNSWDGVEKVWGKDKYNLFISNLKQLWDKLGHTAANGLEKANGDGSSTGNEVETDGQNMQSGLIKYNPEVEKDDVQIGHTYFVYNSDRCKSEEEAKAYIQYRLEYEIKPILHEYRNDEIILNSKNDIDGLEFEYTEKGDDQESQQ